MRKNLTKRERIKDKKTITEFFDTRNAVIHRSLGINLLLLESKNSFYRILIAPSRSIGNSVKRNHSKRITRECYRTLKGRLKNSPCFDLVFILYPIEQDSFCFRLEQMKKLFIAADIYT